jgi:tetratricopeptide (TPR) repeat protein
MSLTKIALVAVVGVGAAAALYGYAYYKFPPPEAEPPKPAPAAVAPMEESPRVQYEICVNGGFAKAYAAERRIAACAKAIISRTLKPDELAFARLNRGAARMALGDRIMAADDFTEALQHYDSAIDPQNPDALNLYRRAATRDAMGETDRAIDEYGEAIRRDPKSPLAFYGRGVLLASRKRAFTRAIGDFDKVLNLQPNNVDALILRGDSYSQLGQVGQALADLNRAVADAPDNPQAFLYRGLAQGRRGEDKLALADYDEAIKLEPRYVDALVNRAAVHAAQGRAANAIRDLDAALAIRPNNAVAHYNRGYALFGQRAYDKAIDDYDAAIALDPTLGPAYNNRCLTRAIAGRDLVEAMGDCDTALRMMPLNLDVRDVRGFIYLKLGDPAIAINEYNAALAIDPNRPIALWGRGLARIRLGQTKEGEADQAAARVLNPNIERQFSIYGLK